MERYTTDLKQTILKERERLIALEMKAEGEIDYKDLMDIDKEVINKEVGFAIQSIVDCTNSSVCDSDKMAEAMFNGIINSHRYLQSEFFIALNKVVQRYAETTFVDERNKWAQQMCKQWAEA